MIFIKERERERERERETHLSPEMGENDSIFKGIYKNFLLLYAFLQQLTIHPHECLLHPENF